MSNDLSGTSNDLSVTFGYNPASQITGVTRSNDAYAYTAFANATTATTSNGLNQPVTIGGSSASWDSKGNLTSDPVSGKTYGYSSENLLTSATGGVTLAYDPLVRLYQVAGAATTRFAYDGANVIAEYDGSNVLQRRFVFDLGLDRPIVSYDASGNRSFLSSDERGSIIAATDSSGALLSVNSYDEYGKPGASNSGRFQYTGQVWLPEIGAYHYKARVYLPAVGVFAQTDPAGGPNLYAAMGGDPVNFGDPTGMDVKENSEPHGPAQPTCSGTRIPSACGAGGISNSSSGFSTAGVGGQLPTGEYVLEGMGFDVGGMSDAEIREFGLGVLGALEYAQAAGLPANTVFHAGYGPNGFVGEFDAAYPQTTIRSLPTDPYGYHFVGRGVAGSDLNTYSLFTTDKKLRVSVFSPNLVQGGGRNGAEPGWGAFAGGGDFLIRFEYAAGDHTNWTFTWSYPGGTSYVPIPADADRLRIVQTTLTPRDTRYEIWAR